MRSCAVKQIVIAKGHPMVKRRAWVSRARSFDARQMRDE